MNCEVWLQPEGYPGKDPVKLGTFAMPLLDEGAYVDLHEDWCAFRVARSFWSLETGMGEITIEGVPDELIAKMVERQKARG